jgi:hypothetical protein
VGIIENIRGTVSPEQDAVTGAVIANHTFGDFVNFNPIATCTGGGFYGIGSFK